MKNVVILGGGISGITLASVLGKKNIGVTLIEKSDTTGGHVKNWHKLFPNLRPSGELLAASLENPGNSGITMITGTEIETIGKNQEAYVLHTGKDKIHADAVVLATGFDLFEAAKKEEYGYGIYDNVITSAELEQLFESGNGILTPGGKKPRKIAFVHCVGSRDAKIGNHYCSKVCCITGIKQAVEVKQAIPEADVYCLYMDLRMYGRHYEEFYKNAQEEFGINFIRGRLSEAFEDPSGAILLKTEDTLLGKSLKMTVDLLVLLIGMVPSAGTKKYGKMLGLSFGDDGFITPLDEQLYPNLTIHDNVFVTGTCKGPKTIEETVSDARSCGLAVADYLSKTTK